MYNLYLVGQGGSMGGWEVVFWSSFAFLAVVAIVIAGLAAFLTRLMRRR